MTPDRSDLLSLAADLDRLTRLLHVSTRPMAKVVDHARIGPFGAMILLTISDHEPLPMLELAKLLGRDKAQMTRAVQMLERSALVERKSSEKDGRVSLVSLTTDGKDLAKGFLEILADVVGRLFDELGDAERQNFANTLAKALQSHMDGR